MLVSPHDTLFKVLFSEPRRAAEVLRQWLPAEVAAGICWSTLVLEPGSFIDEKLRVSHTDLLFSVEMHGRPVKIYVLFEHQSTSDRRMPRRLLRYMNRIWDSLPVDEELPVILPVVLYHDEAPWHGPRDHHGLFVMPPGCAPYVPQFEFILVDLAAQDPDALMRWAVSACVRLGLLVLRSGRAPGQPDELLLRWKSLIREMMAESTERGALRVILVYIFEVWGAQEFKRVIHMYAEIARDYPSAGDDMETIAQMLRREGRTEGRTEGQAEGQRSMLLSVIQQRLGVVPEAVRAQVEAADEAGLQRWLVRALASASVEELQAG